MNFFKPPGIPCPQCNQPIVVQPLILLEAKSVECNRCGLMLQIDVEKSAPAIEGLRSYLKEVNRLKDEISIASTKPDKSRSDRIKASRKRKNLR